VSFLKKILPVSGEKFWTAHKAFHFFAISRQLGTFIISIVLPNSDIGLSFIGNYEFLLFIGISFTLFLSQGFLDAFNLLYKDSNNRFPFSVYFFSLLIGFLIVSILIGFENSIVHFLTSSSKVEFYLLYSIHLFLDFNTWLTPIFLLRKGYKKMLTYYAIIVNSLWIILVTLPPIFNWNLQFIFIGLIILSILKQTFLVILLYKYATFSIDWISVKVWLKKSFPFMGYALLGGLHIIADNWMVGHYFPGDKEIFAIFRYGARELPLSIIIASAFATANVHILQENSVSGLIEFKKKTRQLSHVFFLFAIFSLLFAKQIFILIYGNAFELSAYIFGVYILVIISRLLVLKPLIMAYNLNHWLVPIAISELFVNVIVSYLLVPVLGIVGIAWGTVVAYSYEKIFMVIILQLKSKLSLGQYFSMPSFAFYTVVMIICYLLVFTN
jgi:O-antigen/teichoic acid export membrane protein